MKNEFISHQKMIENLKNPSLDAWYKVYYGNKGKRKTSMKKTKKKYTLNQLGETVDKLVMTVNQLSKTVDEGFKQVNERIDRIERRLDYNNLKKLPN